MNALARLIKPRNSESACTAVTLVGETLYVSMNNTGSKFNFESIFEITMKRLNILLNYSVVTSPDLKYENTYNMKTKESTAGDELLNPRYVCQHQSPHTTPIKAIPIKSFHMWSDNEKENIPLPNLFGNTNGFFKEVVQKTNRQLNFRDVQDNDLLNQAVKLDLKFNPFMA
jgi:hypothetical protein